MLQRLLLISLAVIALSMLAVGLRGMQDSFDAAQDDAVHLQGELLEARARLGTCPSARPRPAPKSVKPQLDI